MPVLLELEGRPAVIVGGGDEAVALASTLLSHGAVLTVVASSASQSLHELAATGRATLLSRTYVRGDLAGAFFAACFEAGEVASAVAAEASAERCLLIIPGCPELSTVRIPAPADRPASIEESA